MSRVALALFVALWAWSLAAVAQGQPTEDVAASERFSLSAAGQRAEQVHDSTGEVTALLAAQQYYDMAALRGDVTSRGRLGYLYLQHAQAFASRELVDVAAIRYRGAALLNRAVTAGNPAAMYLLGMTLERGLLAPPNGAAAEEWFGRAAEAGDLDAVAWMANRPSGPDSMRWLIRAADAGVGSAAMTIAGRYESGNGSAKDLQLAERYYAVAEKNGAPGAAASRARVRATMQELAASIERMERDRDALRHELANQREQLEATGAKLAERELAVGRAEAAAGDEARNAAIARGERDALRSAQALLEARLEVLASARSEAANAARVTKRELASERAERGRAERFNALLAQRLAQATLERRTRDAQFEGVDTRRAELAVQLLLSNQTLAEAQVALAEREHDRSEPTAKLEEVMPSKTTPFASSDSATAIHSVADTSNPEIADGLALLESKRYADARRVFERVAEGGNASALNNLAVMHVYGWGTPPNAAAARNLFERAANAGSGEAAFNLGYLYEAGVLGAPDAVMALRWYQRAEALGNPQAPKAVAEISIAAIRKGS